MINRLPIKIIIIGLKAVILFTIGLLMIFFPVQAVPEIPSAQFSENHQAEDDLTGIRIDLSDLNDDFVEMSENQLSGMERMMGGLLTGLENASLVNLTGYITEDVTDPQYLISGIIAPLTPQEIIQVDQQISSPEAIEELMKNIGGSELTALDFTGYRDLGNTRFGFSTQVSSFRLDYVVARRSYLLIEVAYLYPEGREPLLNAIEEANGLDEKAIAIVGRGEQVGFRSADLLVPELTTYVPTPLDISTDPGVVGSNLFLAAVVVIGFSIGVEILTRTMSNHQDGLWQQSAPFMKLRERLQKFSGHFRVHIGQSRFTFVLKFLTVILFYGLVFSLLDPTWKPFSLTGLVLFANMTIAYGVVGLFDDIVHWIRLRKWQVQAEFSVRSENVFLSLFSTMTTRVFRLVPGLMFGTPKALKANEDQLDEGKQFILHRISVISILGIGFGLWLITTITTLLQRFPLPSFTMQLVGGLEGFFLIVFAVAVENTFIQMLGFSGSLGESIKQKNRWLWLIGIVLVTFFFYHTLINPRGDLAEAFRSGNVQFSLIAMVLFIIFAISMSLYCKPDKRLAITSAEQKEFISDQQLPNITGAPQSDDAAFIEEPSDDYIKRNGIGGDQQQTPVLSYVGIGEQKTCPICSNSIKAEAKLCRYCRALFEVTQRGYCAREHDVVEADQHGKCKRCGALLEDLHIESRLIVQSDGAVQLEPTHSSPTPSQADMKNCPYCGKQIKAGAVICRYCKNELSQIET